MRFMKVLLAASLLANLILGVLLLTRSSSSTQPEASPRNSRTTAESPAVSAEAQAVFWSNLSSLAPAALADLLKTGGCPPELRRAIVTALVRKRFAQRIRALVDQQEPPSYWRRNVQNPINPKFNAALSDIYLERDNLLRSLLGDEGSTEDPISQVLTRQMFGSLAKDKVEKINLIVADYNNLRAHVQADANGVMRPLDRDAMALLEKESRGEIEQTLSKDELFEYDLRTSKASQYLRLRLGTFEASEAEYRSLFTGARAFEAQMGSLDWERPSPNTEELIVEAILLHAKTVLTPERFEEFKRKSHFNR